VNVPTSRFTLVVVPKQLHLQLALPVDEGQKTISTVLVALVGALPHTPYVAAGCNFAWTIEPRGGDLPATTRRLFGSSVSPLAKTFEQPDACYGFFASKNVGSARLQLDIKPVKKADSSELPMIHCAFNFHVNLNSDTALEQVTELCESWSEFHKLSKEIADVIACEAAK
jgi:hypothetical protein